VTPTGPVALTVGTAEGFAGDVVLPLAPTHPATHGLLRLRLTVDGEVITACEPLVGYLHRGAEKLFEARDFRQIIMLANRHDWLSAFGNELGVVLAVERLMGMVVPERAVWLRTALAELTRVLHHLMFLGACPPDATGPTPATHAASIARDRLLRVLEEACGGRVHAMFNRVGGLSEEVPAGWTGRARSVLGALRHDLAPVDTLIRADPSFHARTVGVGVLAAATAAAFGVSGPAARGSGLDFDLRRDEPYLAYGELTVPVVTRSAGDCQARFECLLEQLHVAADLAVECLDRVDQVRGPVNTRLPKVVRPPEGHIYAWTENPTGINGYYLVSRGTPAPWRLMLRTASYPNVQALSAIIPGSRVADLTTILGSMFFVIGDLDK